MLSWLEGTIIKDDTFRIYEGTLRTRNHQAAGSQKDDKSHLKK